MTKAVAVSRATGGIGESVVEALATAGYRVLAFGRSQEKLDAVRSRFVGLVPVVLDLAPRADTVDELTGIDELDGLVHCAGVSEVASVEGTPRTLWEETFAVNVTGAAALTRALLPALRAVGGHVVFVNAAPGLHAVPNWSAYTASKAALRELADSLREEEARHGVRVTTIYPGGVRAELLRKVREQFGRPCDPTVTVSPQTLASLVLTVLEFPIDVQITEVSLRAAPRNPTPRMEPPRGDARSRREPQLTDQSVPPFSAPIAAGVNDAWKNELASRAWTYLHISCSKTVGRARQPSGTSRSCRDHASSG